MKNLGQLLKEAVLNEVQQMNALLAQNEESGGAVAKAFRLGIARSWSYLRQVSPSRIFRCGT